VYFSLAEEASLILYLSWLLSFYLSLFSLNHCCPLYSGVHCHSAFGPLCVFFFNLKKKRLFSLQRVHESIPPPQKKKDYLKQCSLRKEQKYIQWFCARTATFLIFFFLSLLYSQRPGSFHLKHASLVRKWHSAHSEAPMQFRYVMWKCWVGLGHIMMSNSEAHMSYGLYLLEQWFPTCGSQDELEGSKWREEWKEIR